MKNSRQHGAAILIMMLVLVMLAMSAMFKYMDGSSVKIERDKKTAAALAEAKAALIGYAESKYLEKTCASPDNCARPGDLPCPDFDNNGEADSSCGNAAGTTAQGKRLGRLPWKTLGLGDLRDGYGERLWYAVSNSYKSSARKFPLNSNTLGTITLRNSSGSIVYDGSGNNGLAALVISAGPPLESQNRSLNDVSNYLDGISMEKNTDFIDGDQNGFIMGPVFDTQGNIVVNDRFLEIRNTEITNIMSNIVLRQSTKEFVTSQNTQFFPYPADLANADCLLQSIPDGKCPSVSGLALGFLPAVAWPSTSIFRGIKAANWFQQNEWRGLIKYSVSSSCVNGATSCKISYSASNKTLSVQ